MCKTGFRVDKHLAADVPPSGAESVIFTHEARCGRLDFSEPFVRRVEMIGAVWRGNFKGWHLRPPPLSALKTPCLDDPQNAIENDNRRQSLDRRARATLRGARERRSSL